MNSFVKELILAIYSTLIPFLFIVTLAAYKNKERKSARFYLFIFISFTLFGALLAGYLRNKLS